MRSELSTCSRLFFEWTFTARLFGEENERSSSLQYLRASAAEGPNRKMEELWRLREKRGVRKLSVGCCFSACCRWLLWKHSQQKSSSVFRKMLTYMRLSELGKRKCGMRSGCEHGSSVL